MKKADKYILLSIGFLFAVSTLSIYVFKTFFSAPGATAIITQNKHVIHTIDLSLVTEPYEINIASDNNGSNTIYVEKNKIKFIAATCPDQLCVKSGTLSHTSDIAVCLPHGLFIQIEGGIEGEMDILAH